MNCTITIEYTNGNKKKLPKPVKLMWDGSSLTNIPPPNLTPREMNYLRWATRVIMRLCKMLEV